MHKQVAAYKKRRIISIEAPPTIRHKGCDALIELKDIVVRFGDFEALHSMSVAVKNGEFFSFLGSSGRGKTTTLRTNTGNIEPTSGAVRMQHEDITHVPIKQHNIGTIFQGRTTVCT